MRSRAGYDARRLAKGEAPPQRGVRIRGVFAEADEQNVDDVYWWVVWP